MGREPQLRAVNGMERWDAAWLKSPKILPAYIGLNHPMAGYMARDKTLIKRAR